MDPRIGILQKADDVVYYAFADGYDRPETCGTRAEVEAALGLRPSTPPVGRKPARAKRYEVTVTPSVIGYFPGGSTGPYTVEIDATTAREACQKARRAYRDEEGRFAPVVTCTAARLDP